jgi:hypothetical protein
MGIGKVVVVRHRRMVLIVHTRLRGVRRIPVEDLKVVVTLMVVVDDRMDLIAFVVLDLGVSLAHCSLENHIRSRFHHFHFHLSVMVQIRFP